MKRVFLSLALILATTLTFAQTPTKITAGVDAVHSAGKGLNKTWQEGFGASGQIEKYVSDKVSIEAQAGFVTYVGKKFGTLRATSISQLPVLAGVNYYLTSSFYTAGSAGISFFNKNAGNYFTYSAGIGNTFDRYNVSIKYTSAVVKNGPDLSNLGLRLAYTF